MTPARPPLGSTLAPRHRLARCLLLALALGAAALPPATLRAPASAAPSEAHGVDPSAAHSTSSAETGTIVLDGHPLPVPYRKQGRRVLFPLRALAEPLHQRLTIDAQKHRVIQGGKSVRAALTWIRHEPHVTYRGLLQVLGQLRFWMDGDTACLASSAAPAAAPTPSKPAAPSPSAQATADVDLVLAELNLARTDPAGYASKLEAMRGWYQGRTRVCPSGLHLITKEGLPALDEAIAFLKAQAPCSAVTLSPGLSRAAADHVRDQGSTGSTGHSGSDGSLPAQRMERHGRWQHTCGENIAYGASAAEVVIELLIDDGVSDRGHRINIYRPGYHTVGIALGPHPQFRTMCVMDLAGGYTDAP